ncbi:MAG: hypothetical protein V1779_16855 [bacterium]
MQKRILNRILRKIFKKENRLFLYLSLVIISILFLSAYANKWSSGQTIESFVITGNKFIPTDELLGNVDSSLIECLRNDVELLELKDEIVKHPYILTSYVMQKNSSVIEIEVTERIPIALLVKNDGNLCYCDAMGYILPYRLSLQFHELPILRNLFIYDKVDTNALLDAVSILKRLDKPEFSRFERIVSELEYDRKRKSFIITTGDNAYKVIFGNAKDINKKLDLICDFFENSLQEIKTSDIKYIDTRWDERIIVQMNDINEQPSM